MAAMTPITVTMIPTMATTIEKKPPLKLRHELKHRINPQDDLIVSARLRKLFPHDPNGGPGEATGCAAFILTPLPIGP